MAVKRESSTVTPGSADTTKQQVRLNKAIAGAGVCSRRKADELIAAGKVKVNGQVVTELGTKVVPDKDTIEVEGRTIGEMVACEADHLYIVLHKPVQVVTTAHDPQSRNTVLDLLPDRLRKRRPFPVGRLDFFSEGLLLLTTDGDLAHRLTHPSFHLPKVYELRLRGMVSTNQIQTMAEGMVLKDGTSLAPVEISIAQSDRNSTIMRMTLIQGVNRQIRRMCEELGLVILTLKRVSQGPVELGDLKPGEFRELTPDEIKTLKGAVRLV
ncbi:MAG: pseudouridine synthase [Desulfovibrionales bacterium]